MTRSEAKAEAVKRWGDGAGVIGRSPTRSNKRTVHEDYGYRVFGPLGQPGGQYGEGNSWEAAFTNADKLEGGR